jgi:hypothetical protein
MSFYRKVQHSNSHITPSKTLSSIKNKSVGVHKEDTHKKLINHQSLHTSPQIHIIQNPYFSSKDLVDEMNDVTKRIERIERIEMNNDHDYNTKMLIQSNHQLPQLPNSLDDLKKTIDDEILNLKLKTERYEQLLAIHIQQTKYEIDQAKMTNFLSHPETNDEKSYPSTSSSKLLTSSKSPRLDELKVEIDEKSLLIKNLQEELIQHNRDIQYTIDKLKETLQDQISQQLKTLSEKFESKYIENNQQYQQQIQVVSSYMKEIQDKIFEEFKNIKQNNEQNYNQNIEELKQKLKQLTDQYMSHYPLLLDESNRTRDVIKNDINTLREFIQHIHITINSKINQVISDMNSNNNSNSNSTMDTLVKPLQDAIKTVDVKINNAINSINDKVDAVDSKINDKVNNVINNAVDSKINDKVNNLINESVDNKINDKINNVTQLIRDKVNDVVNTINESVDSKINDKINNDQPIINSIIKTKIQPLQDDINTIKISLEDVMNSTVKPHDNEMVNDTVNNAVNTLINNRIQPLQDEVSIIKTSITENILNIQTISESTEHINVGLQELNSTVVKIQQNNEITSNNVDKITDAINWVQNDIKTIEEKLQQNKQLFDNKMATVEEKFGNKVNINQEIDKLSSLYKTLDQNYTNVVKDFKSQFETLQKRYQQLHTIMVSNMEETERGNQGVKDLIELHQKMETEYKDMTITYEKQHDEYKQSLQDRDDKLRILETQVKNQINSIEGKLTNVQNKEIDVNNQRMSRINELAQPRFITPKK